MVEARERTSSISASGATTRFTNPIADASSAVTAFPVKISSLAFANPTSLARRSVPENPGVMPSPTSGCPNVAFSDAMRISHASASSQPPPRAKPFTAAMTG
ncbi:hypothetical protein SDC9_118869 [bioreactor metagenome]|uniref:Uncharacterized protein n=1 Tax=bioreactor metagenome TaxID=1076179 RepID=A0A645C3F6_9ZZZZ